MTNVTQIRPTSGTYRYRDGDIVRALAQGVRHEVVAADIERVLRDILFFPEESEDKRYDAICEASNLLHNLLVANGMEPQP